MRDEIDYRARSALLYATTDIMRPPPIDTLMDKMPEFRRWLADREIDREGESSHVTVLRELAAQTNCKMSNLNETPAAVALKKAVAAWMEKYGFRDEWIADAALCTLNEHAVGRAKPRSWHFFVDAEQIQPMLTGPQVRKRNDESLRQFIGRAELEWKKQRKEFVKRFQFRFGLRKGHLQPARWTAQVFAGSSFVEVASTGKLDESTVRKAVEGFCKCAKLQLQEKKSGRS
jgi:hypothetical protein